MGMPKPDSATLITQHIRDLIGRPLEVSLQCAEDPNTERDKARRSTSRNLAARAMAAQAILRAMRPDTVGNGSFETILERMEGKVGGNETGGSTINFNFVVQGDQGVRQVGELVQGVIASATTNSMQSEPALAQTGILGAVNPSSRSTPGINHPLALPAHDPDRDEDAHNNGAD